jgi:hypothetical protein
MAAFGSAGGSGLPNAREPSYSDVGGHLTRLLVLDVEADVSRLVDYEPPPPENAREFTLRKEGSQLKRLLADKTVEVDFFQGALQKVEARRQGSGNSGARASTTRSGK